MDQEQTERWTDLLTSAGHRPGAVLGAGMELPGRVVATFLRGKATVLDGKLA